MPKSVYIHIPFCKSKCKYCSFVSYSKLGLIEDYVEALSKDIKYNYRGESLDTLYIGGGTPSVLESFIIGKIIQLFNFNTNYELTVELNPDDVNKKYLLELNSYGVNRLSFGSQTFNDEILKYIGRRHNSRDVINSVKMSQDAGFDNISVDLIYGLPYQNLDLLLSDINKFLDLEINHISTYGLKIEEQSAWGKLYNKNDNSLLNKDGSIVLLPDGDMQADMYELINSKLEENSLFRYEVSNFAKRGYESRHNLNYWNNAEYYGFGIASHGYVNSVRYSKPLSFKEYFDDPKVYKECKFLSNKDKLEEEIFLGFRKRSGIDVNLINSKYGIDFELKYANVIEKYKDFIEKTPVGYTFNLQGVLLSNIILSEFI